MVNKVLLIEDDIKISDLVKDSLLDEGYVVDQAFDGEEGYFKILENQPDLIILDIMIPKMNGFKVCAKVREHGVMSPILMLTAKSGEYDVEEGLDTGANDYLRKPFSMIELLARVRKLLKKDIAPTNTLEFQDLKIDLAARKATHNKLEIELTRQEFDLLSYLLDKNLQDLAGKGTGSGAGSGVGAGTADELGGEAGDGTAPESTGGANDIANDGAPCN